MTPERAKELLPVWQAYADGKTVQLRQPSALDPDLHQWRDYTRETTDPYYFVCASPNVEWRVKPEPREWWLVLRTHPCVESSTSFDCKDTADAFAKNTTFQPATVVHVREVLP